MNKKELSKDERIKNLRSACKVFVVLIVLLLFCLMLNEWLNERNLVHARVSGKMDVWTEEEMCVNIHNRSLDAEGYCDITNEYVIGRDYYEYFDCSWGKLKVQSEGEKHTLKDKYRFWYSKCDFIKMERVE